MNIDRLAPGVEDLLTWSSKRQQALAGNLANVDTPNYRAIDFNFTEAMKFAMLETSSPGHLQPDTAGARIEMYEVDAKVKDNGNSVEIEREMTELTKNGLQYVALLQYMNQKMRTLRTSIVEGGKV